MEEVSLIETIEASIYNYSRESGERCKVILTHPNTWFKFWDELVYAAVHSKSQWANSMISEFSMSGKYTYKGIPVIRSYDVADGEFLIF